MNAITSQPAVRHDGWTPARKILFLYELAACGSVRTACSEAGLSPEAAYKLRRRDALFARAWAAALVLAREASAEVLECRALDGIEEQVWYHGEVVGTRTRYDTRLLLAHIARLDAQAQAGTASEDAARFDELLACVGGAAPPSELSADEDGMPLSREACVDIAGKEAELVDEEGEDAGRAIARYHRARAAAARRWHLWTSTAHAATDRLLAEPRPDPVSYPFYGFRTPSTSSTSSPSAAPRSMGSG